MNTPNKQTSREFNPPWTATPKAKQPWRQFVGNRELAIEIGPGVGLHPLQYAQSNPDKFVIGIEKTTEKYTKFARRANNHLEITNLLAIHANAVEWISKNIHESEVSEYYLLYPNPYPKAAQKNKRLMHMPFMHHLIDTMKTDATLTIATNMHFFYLDAKETINELQLVKDSTVSTTSRGRTHFERKYLKDGQQCYELVFQKKTPLVQKPK